MFKKILIALARSEMGKQVFEQGFALTKMTEANLMPLHV
nr:universal stress protein [Fischerella sp. PCC 9605]